ncbi:hypothetical protein EVAR_18754_1 [Eumeta japonica]|uniref:Uncharacterized protein n=1 Tax=Eumeta variegata TaxID=151549 RepID=A0A4C1UMK7_EUMVA|nr:hypothetical protein EVAR_18754_1 [Eumeta japonica]
MRDKRNKALGYVAVKDFPVRYNREMWQITRTAGWLDPAGRSAVQCALLIKATPDAFAAHDITARDFRQRSFVSPLVNHARRRRRGPRLVKSNERK